MNATTPRVTEVPRSFLYRFEDVEFDEAKMTLRVGTAQVKIEPRPLKLLALLLRTPGEVVSKEELFSTLWSGLVTVEHVLTNAVGRLRKALGHAAAQRVVTVPRVGYRFDGSVERIAKRTPSESFLQLSQGATVAGREGFKLVRQLAHSSDRAVWLAEDHRSGELRVYKFATDGDALALLKREASLHALLRRTLGPRLDFTQVISSNFAVSPYFVECAYGGDDLPAWADKQGGLSQIALDQRIQLMIQVADAVHRAHGVGVLHRDIKPGNILINRVDDRWHVCMTDFGSGRLLVPGKREELGLAGMGLTVSDEVATEAVGSGTLMYMAPELLAGESPTTQSDVYSLGCVLYQMAVADLNRSLSTGWERDVPDELLRSDIAAATEGKPVMRLKSASELAERLRTLEERRLTQQRYAAEQEHARRLAADLAAMRLRRPWVVVAMAALAGGLGVSIWFQHQTAQALSEARRQSDKAAAMNQFLAKDVLQSVDSTAVPKGVEVSLSAVLKKASERAGIAFKAHPDLEAEIRTEIGQGFRQMSHFKEAENEFRLTLGILGGMKPIPKKSVLKTQYQLGMLLAEMSRLDEAEHLLAQADLAVYAEPVSNDEKMALASAGAHFTLRFMQQRFEKALPYGKQMVKLIDTVHSGDRAKRSSARHMVADALFRLGKLPEAEAMIRDALAIGEAPPAIGEGILGRIRLQMARIRLAAGEMEGTEALLIDARQTLQEVLGNDDYYVSVANSELGNLYLERAEFQKALSVLMEAHAGFMKNLGPEHQSTHIATLNLALVQLETDQAARALATLESERPWFVVSLGGEGSPVVQAIDFNRALGYSRSGRPGQALELLNSLDPEKLAQAQPAKYWAARVRAELGNAMLASGQRAQGSAQIQAGIQEMEAVGAPEGLMRHLRAAAAQAAGR